MRRAFVCVGCGERATRDHRATRLFCWACNAGHLKEGVRAIALVTRAVRHKEIPPPSALECMDCAKPARDYDHRDYTKPLEVVPVCRSCNLKRGPAFDSKHRPASLPT